jgi:chromosome partitioning protein
MNLAAALTEQGKRVLCIDLDPQSNLTMSFGIDVERLDKSIFDVLVNRMPIEHIIQKTPECDIAVSNIDLAGAELALSGMIGRERALEKAISQVKRDYDFILIDTPPSLGLLTINAFTASDEVIVPVQAEYLSLRGLVQLDNTLAIIREHLNPRVQILGILRTMYDGRTIHSREAVELLERTYGPKLLKTVIRKTIRFAEAPVQGSSVLRYDTNGKAAEMYRELAQEVLAAHVTA